MKGIALIAIITIMGSCSMGKTTIKSKPVNAQAPVIIYKTKPDFYNKVPVVLNKEKDQVISYPAPSDLFFEGALALPVKLKNGYLLDRRGLSPNSVFTSYTYEEYSKLDSPPSLEDLFERISDKNPFESMYNCGKRGDFEDLEKELNKAITNGMENCVLLK